MNKQMLLIYSVIWFFVMITTMAYTLIYGFSPTLNLSICLIVLVVLLITMILIKDRGRFWIWARLSRSSQGQKTNIKVGNVVKIFHHGLFLIVEEIKNNNKAMCRYLDGDKELIEISLDDLMLADPKEILPADCIRLIAEGVPGTGKAFLLKKVLELPGVALAQETIQTPHSIVIRFGVKNRDGAVLANTNCKACGGTKEDRTKPKINDGGHGFYPDCPRCTAMGTIKAGCDHG